MFDILRFLKRGGRPEGRRARRRQQALGFGPYDRRLVCEALEARTLLSGGPQLPAGGYATPIAVPYLPSDPTPTNSASAAELTPNQVRGAYGLGSYSSGVLSNGITFAGIQGDGRGQTIAIVDAADDPNALSDLNYFSSYYGLPTFGGAGNPTFQKLNESGNASPLPAASGTSGWSIEESLDIEWAHAMAPMANIILFEANSSYDSDLYPAVYAAAHTPGVVVVSMSWSGGELGSGETSDDSAYFVTPAGHLGGADPLSGANLSGGVTFLAAAGDDGAYTKNTTAITPQYPACSPNVVAVGGTTLLVNGNSPNYAYGSETIWGDGTASGTHGGGGGGTSLYESQPSYQNGVVAEYNTSISTTMRDYPDVSADADPNSGVPVYDTYDATNDSANYGSNPWQQYGGTSLACPLWAGMIAVADEGRAIAGQGSLDGLSQTLPALYKMPAADIHDITSGNNGYAAGTGYDLASGLGSPVGNLLIPQLAGPSIVMGAAAVAGSTTNLSVLGADSGGESTLTYTWAATTLPSGASAPLSVNGSNAAKNTTATLSKAGTYIFTVTITDAVGLSVTSSVSVTVSSAQLVFDVTAQPFTATALDQSGNPLATQPQSPWSLDGNGGVDFDSTAGGTVNFDGVSPSFADVTFSASGYSIGQQGSGGTLQLGSAASPATLTVAAGSDTISAPVALDNNVTILPAAGSQLTISGGISGPGALSVADQGTVVLTGTNTYTGGTTVSAGTLVVNNSSAIAANTSLTIGAGGAFVFDPTVDATSSAVAAATPAATANSARTAVASNTTSTPAFAATSNSTSIIPTAASSVATSHSTGQQPKKVLLPQIVGPVANLPLKPCFWRVGNLPALSAPETKKDAAIRTLDAVFAQYGQ